MTGCGDGAGGCGGGSDDDGVICPGSLQEALVSLERARRREASAKTSAQRLIGASQRLIAARTAADLRDGVAQGFADIAPCDGAFLLAPAPDGGLIAAAQTAAGPALRARFLDGALARAVEGRSAVVNDVGRAKGWDAVVGPGVRAARSALLTPVSTLSTSYVLLALSARRSAFDRGHAAAAAELAPIAAEALIRAEQLEALEHSADRLRHMAHHDTLTGLRNRQTCLRAIDDAIAELNPQPERPLALLKLDLDGFTALNAALGSQVGDQILSAIAERLRRMTREGGAVARLGGDEFGLVLPELPSPEAAAAIADRVRRAVSKPLRVGGTSVTVKTSVGVSLAPQNGTNGEALARAAKHALHDAKTAGKGRTAFYDSAFSEELERRRHIEKLLHQALAGDEFELHYQPVVDPIDRRVRAFEALIRWRNAKLGLVSPGAFLKVAEEAGLMEEIGDWVLRRACAETAPWLRAGDAACGPRRVAINVAAPQIASPDFVSSVVRAAASAGLSPEMVELELSEEIVLQRTAERAFDNLLDLSSRRFQIAFDDFGTGYSSLSQLRSFPGHRLKIDRAFIRDCAERPEDQRVVRGLVDLAASLELEVVAEGVETAEQLAVCRRAGVHEIQGFYFAKPAVMADAIAAAEALEDAAA